jgi:aldehyde:ferredoxin oxidoreductase
MWGDDRVTPGYHGRYLRIDPSPGGTKCVPLAEKTLRAFLGGVGLGAWILANETGAGVDPLGSESVLVFSFSPLVGSPLTTSAKFAVVAFSPLTGRVCDALSSSHFAIAGKRTGVDAIAITGISERPSIVLIDGTGSPDPTVLWFPADFVWGMSAAEAESRIRERIGPDWQVAAIGPAGERLIPFATISHDGRHAGRGGLGAVLGAKRIKAIAVRGDRRAPLANPDRALELAKHYSRLSFGPATEKYRELGTVSNLLTFNRFHTLPTRNFQSSQFDGAERLMEPDLGPSLRIARASCAACTIGCEHIYAARPAKTGAKSGVRLEYESLYALGPLCGVDDRDAVLTAARACDDAGIDTISTGATIAFLMECSERGLIAVPLDPSGRPLRFGDGIALIEAVEALVDRRGRLGHLLAMGSRRAAQEIGGIAPDLAPHVKGMELPGYDPRSMHTMALGLAVGTRGADHNRSGAYEADFSDRADRRQGGEHSARLAIETEDRAAVIDSLILCKFIRGVFTDPYAEWAELIAAVTGWSMTADELRTVAERVVNARKCLNEREGWSRAEDTLPERLFGVSAPASQSTASTLTRERLDVMISAYYHERGWDNDGRVPEVRRSQLGLDGPCFGVS